jgi:hypothetical protein
MTEPVRSRPAVRVSETLLFVLPILLIGGVLVGAYLVAASERCGGPVPGCGMIRNTGDLPIAVRGVTADGQAGAAVPTTVKPGNRVLLVDATGLVRVNGGQCLRVQGGPLWNAESYIDAGDSPGGRWHPVDDWGARVEVFDSPCADLMGAGA